MTTAEIYEGLTSVDVNLQQGDTIVIFSKWNVVEDGGDSFVQLGLDIEGLTRDYSVMEVTPFGTMTMSTDFVYHALTDEEITIEAQSPSGGFIEDGHIQVIVISVDDPVEVDTPALNVGIGFGLFLATMFFFVWFFRSKRN